MNDKIVKIINKGMTPTGLIIPKDTTFDDCFTGFKYLLTVNRASKWAIGDMLLFVEERHPEKHLQMLDAFEYEYQALMDIKYVCFHVEFSRRREILTFSHHREIAPLYPEDQDKFLEMAIADNLTVMELRKEIKEWKRAQGESKPQKSKQSIPIEPVEDSGAEYKPKQIAMGTKQKISKILCKNCIQHEDELINLIGSALK